MAQIIQSVAWFLFLLQVFLPLTLPLTEFLEQLPAQLLRILPSFHSGSELAFMVQTWLESGFGNLGFSKEDKRDLAKDGEWVDGL